MKLTIILALFWFALVNASNTDKSPPGLRITSDEVAADISRRSGGTCKSSWCVSPDQTNRSAFDCFVDLTDKADKCLCQRGVAVLSSPYIDVKPGNSKDWSFSRLITKINQQELQRYMCCEDISNPSFSNLDSITSDKIVGESCGRRDNLNSYEFQRFYFNMCIFFAIISWLILFCLRCNKCCRMKHLKSKKREFSSQTEEPDIEMGLPRRVEVLRVKEVYTSDTRPKNPSQYV